MQNAKILGLSLLLLTAVLTASLKTNAAEPAISSPPESLAMIPFHYDNGEISAMIAAYAKASGKKIIVDPGVRGRATVLLPGDVSVDEAFNILCEVLSVNGFTVVDVGDTMVIKSARNAQRDSIPTVREVPPAKPNRMITLILKLKYASVGEVNKRLRLLPSKDGEMSPYEATNELVVSDYAANLVRIAKLVGELDTPEAAAWEKKKLKEDPDYFKPRPYNGEIHHLPAHGVPGHPQMDSMPQKSKEG